MTAPRPTGAYALNFAFIEPATVLYVALARRAVELAEKRDALMEKFNIEIPKCLGAFVDWTPQQKDLYHETHIAIADASIAYRRARRAEQLLDDVKAQVFALERLKGARHWR